MIARGKGLTAPVLSAIVVALLTAIGAFLRVQVAGQALFADELSTYWIVTGTSLTHVLATVYSHAEISPPAFFVASWLTTQWGNAPEFVRLPSLIAGCVTIPLVYVLGLRLVNRATGITAAALTTFSPFMIYYSADARGYALMMCVVTVSTYTMLRAVDTGRTRWWCGYGLAMCAAMYTHYTAVFALAAQFVWLLWAHPESRRRASLATLGAVVGFLPWVPGLVMDFQSWTLPILFYLQPFTPDAVRVSLQNWAFGYPYAITWWDRGSWSQGLPGPVGFGLLAIAFLLAVTRPFSRSRRLPPGTVLVVMLAIAAPVGAALASAGGVRLFSVRGLAASWPGFGMMLAALLCAAGPRRGPVAAALAVAAFALSSGQMLTERYQRPDYRTAAEFIDRQALAGDVVVDHTAVLSPGPLSGVDAAFRRSHQVFRAGAPQQRDHPFGYQDPKVPLEDALRDAVTAAGGRRVFLVSHAPLPGTIGGTATVAGYRLVESERYEGIVPVFVGAYTPHPQRDH